MPAVVCSRLLSKPYSPSNLPLVLGEQFAGIRRALEIELRAAGLLNFCSPVSTGALSHK